MGKEVKVILKGNLCGPGMPLMSETVVIMPEPQANDLMNAGRAVLYKGAKISKSQDHIHKKRGVQDLMEYFGHGKIPEGAPKPLTKKQKKDKEKKEKEDAEKK